MTLLETIKKELAAAMKAKDETQKKTLRIILGELARLDNKTPDDDEIIKVLKKLVKAEKETLQHQGQSESSEYIGIIEHYLPRQATAEEIRAWIQENIDFSQYQNKMQSMREIMQHFGSQADGNTVKKILQQM
jgi:uncharacterized protein YqeY